MDINVFDSAPLLHFPEVILVLAHGARAQREATAPPEARGRADRDYVGRRRHRVLAPGEEVPLRVHEAGAQGGGRRRH